MGSRPSLAVTLAYILSSAGGQGVCLCVRRGPRWVRYCSAGFFVLRLSTVMRVR